MRKSNKKRENKAQKAEKLRATLLKIFTININFLSKFALTRFFSPLPPVQKISHLLFLHENIYERQMNVSIKLMKVNDDNDNVYPLHTRLNIFQKISLYSLSFHLISIKFLIIEFFFRHNLIYFPLSSIFCAFFSACLSK